MNDNPTPLNFVFRRIIPLSLGILGCTIVLDSLFNLYSYLFFEKVMLWERFWKWFPIAVIFVIISSRYTPEIWVIARYFSLIIGIRLVIFSVNNTIAGHSFHFVVGILIALFSIYSLYKPYIKKDNL